MNIKRFTAPDMRQAMKEVKEFLGPDAVILSNKVTAEGVEITAAIDFSNDDSQTAVQPQRPEVKAEAKTRVSPSGKKEHNEPVTVQQEVDFNTVVESKQFLEMRREMEALKRLMINGMNEIGWQDMARSQNENKEIVHRLLSTGLSPILARRLAAQINPAEDSEQAWNKTLGNLESLIPLSEEDIIQYGGIVALVGPTGVGKTTTIAKLATRFAMKHGAHQVALVTTDDFRIGAREQLQTYGKILNIPVSVVKSSDQMTECLNGLTRYRLVLIDTAGMAFDNDRFQKQMDILDHSKRRIAKLLTLSAATESSALERSIGMYKDVEIDACILTKLDEAGSLGGIISSVIENRLPVSYLTNGQKVPEDLQLARSRALIDLVTGLISDKDQQFDPAWLAQRYGEPRAYAH